MNAKTWFGVALISIVAMISVGCQERRSSDQFHRGRELLIKGRFNAADAELSAFEENHPGHELASRARFLRAKSKMGSGDLVGSQQLFQETIEQFPGSEEAAKARYKIAMIDLIRGDREGAEQKLRAIVNQTDSILVAEATAMLEMFEPKGDE